MCLFKLLNKDNYEPVKQRDPKEYKINTISFIEKKINILVRIES